MSLTCCRMRGDEATFRAPRGGHTGKEEPSPSPSRAMETGSKGWCSHRRCPPLRFGAMAGQCLGAGGLQTGRGHHRAPKEGVTREGGRLRCRYRPARRGGPAARAGRSALCAALGSELAPGEEREGRGGGNPGTGSAAPEGSIPAEERGVGTCW